MKRSYLSPATAKLMSRSGLRAEGGAVEAELVRSTACDSTVDTRANARPVDVVRRHPRGDRAGADEKQRLAARGSVALGKLEGRDVAPRARDPPLQVHDAFVVLVKTDGVSVGAAQVAAVVLESRLARRTDLVEGLARRQVVRGVRRICAVRSAGSGGRAGRTSGRGGSCAWNVAETGFLDL